MWKHFYSWYSADLQIVRKFKKDLHNKKVMRLDLYPCDDKKFESRISEKADTQQSHDNCDNGSHENGDEESKLRVTGAFKDCMLGEDQLSKAIERDNRREKGKRFKLLQEAQKRFINERSDTDSQRARKAKRAKK